MVEGKLIPKPLDVGAGARRASRAAAPPLREALRQDRPQAGRRARSNATDAKDLRGAAGWDMHAQWRERT